MKTRAVCHDCACLEGQLHQLGCDMERCPFCGKQLIGCDCVYELLNIDASPGTWTYSHGLTAEQELQWERLLREKGRVPYIKWPNVCAYCGELWPGLFRVSDAEWAKYIQFDMRRAVVCWECWNHIKTVTDEGLREQG